jgi:MYXO-CTERM domain-containing protein
MGLTMKTMKRFRCVSWFAAGLAAMAPALLARDAQACGGLFCDGGPQSMPVDQSGENILFVWKDGSIEVHIQIQYEGDAEKFGWVIPLQSLPEFSVGSEPLFQALLNSTVPSYGFTTTRDQCDAGQDNNSTAAGGFDDDGDGGDEGTGSADDGGEDPGPQIIETVTAGAFEITVIQGDDAQEVMDWLAENGYLEDEEAVPILQQYIDEGHLFGAVKLTGGAEVDEIHPIVLEFQGEEPCVPLRLTRIAAVENMAVRSFFLGAERMVPNNYRHVLVNPLKIDWLQLGANYNEVITLAVDEQNADGRAFVTEYAGPSEGVPRNFVNPSWDPTDFGTVDPLAIGNMLIAQQLLQCDIDFGGGCAFGHPLMEGLLSQYITPPAGVALGEYLYQQANWPEHDLSTWNGPEFAMKMDEFIIAPGVHASELLEQNEYLTRMFTTISPAEMTEDPMFYENDMLPDVTNVQMGVLRTLCNGEQVFTLPDGRQIYLPEPVWPELPDEPGGEPGRMVSAEIIEAVPFAGAPMNLTDNTAKIDAILSSWNADQGWEDGGSSSGEGCSCALDGRGSAWLGLLLLGGLGVVARRRRP